MTKTCIKFGLNLRLAEEVTICDPSERPSQLGIQSFHLVTVLPVACPQSQPVRRPHVNPAAVTGGPR